MGPVMFITGEASRNSPGVSSVLQWDAGAGSIIVTHASKIDRRAPLDPAWLAALALGAVAVAKAAHAPFRSLWRQLASLSPSTTMQGLSKGA